MGLDVYLYNAADGAANELYDKAWNDFYERPDLDQLSEQDRKAIEKELPQYVSHTDVSSERYPDHLFNRRYLRSSYNDGGFNSAVPQFVGENHDLTGSSSRWAASGTATRAISTRSTFRSWPSAASAPSRS